MATPATKIRVCLLIGLIPEARKDVKGSKLATISNLGVAGASVPFQLITGSKDERRVVHVFENGPSEARGSHQIDTIGPVPSVGEPPTRQTTKRDEVVRFVVVTITIRRYVIPKDNAVVSMKAITELQSCSEVISPSLVDSPKLQTDNCKMRNLKWGL